MKFKHALLAATLLTASATATAAEFWTSVPGAGNLQYAGGTSSRPVTVTGYDGVALQFSGNFWTGGGAAPADSFFRFFCIELGQHADAGPHPYFSSIFADTELAKLFDVAFPNKGAGDFWNGAQTNFGVFGSNVLAAAFQVALWNIVFDTDLDLNNGTFQWLGGDAAVKAAADTMLNDVLNYSALNTSYQNWILYKFQSPVPNCTGNNCTGYQDYVSVRYVPEPGALALFGLGLLGLGAVRRRNG